MNQAITLDKQSQQTEVPSPREQEVLSVVLELMVEEGGSFSMASVAKRASCSKETLYKWFGDRDGLLTATVQWQASKVVTPKLSPDGLTLGIFTKTLEEFAVSWLSVISGDVSIALNRIAVFHAGNSETRLGEIVLQNGPLTMQKRLEPIFALGLKSGFLSEQDDNMFRSFFGLVVADTQIRSMLGDGSPVTKSEIKQFAKSAVGKFLALYGKQ